ncbi:hypothetical protein M422DRAFT_780542 [Sphaerobolus stellatus SS14]|uniref:F-box domain-containing protein n=1 Tax=Sphaerobolus stellatus (strain SS14) TaxID=990650 RepID=A0A0C9VSU6_SPHS4|nr:hypothetical protein M422DRAFT_780542 [Sphaerobolus stellatus SS14]
MSPSFPPLPSELELFSHFSLKTLVASRGGCRAWRSLVLTANIPPARRLLLEFYLELIQDKYFHQTRPWVLDNLKDFDREGYVGALVQQGANLPEEFRLWVLEWPATAAIAGIWLGLPDDNMGGSMDDRMTGRNVLGIIPPQLSSVVFVPKKRCIPAICLWVGFPPDAVWLPLDEEPDLYGKTITCCTRGVLYGTERGDDGVDDDNTNFVQWLRFTWMAVAAQLSAIEERIVWRFNAVGKEPMNKSHDMFGEFDIPAPPWHMKDIPPYDTLLQEALDEDLDAEEPE